MRTLTSLVLILLLAGPALAEKKPDTSPADVVRELHVAVSNREPRKKIWTAYLAAKEAISGAEKAAKKDASLEGAAAEAKSVYEAIRPQVAAALRWHEIPASGWVMGLFAALLLWGGFTYCLRVALRGGGDPDLDEDETWPIRPEEP